MLKEDKKHMAASAGERLRLADVAAAARRSAQSEFARVVSRLEVEDDIRRAETLLVEAEIDLARYGDVAEPIKQSFFQKLLGAGIVIQGKREFEAVVAARRAQLERLRAVEGPERIARADELARVLVEPGRSKAPAEPETVPIVDTTAPHLDGAPCEPAELAVAPPTHKPNGRPARSPYG